MSTAGRPPLSEPSEIDEAASVDDVHEEAPSRPVVRRWCRRLTPAEVSVARRLVNQQCFAGIRGTPGVKALLRDLGVSATDSEITSALQQFDLVDQFIAFPSFLKVLETLKDSQGALSVDHEATEEAKDALRAAVELWERPTPSEYLDSDEGEDEKAASEHSARHKRTALRHETADTAECATAEMLDYVCQVWAHAMSQYKMDGGVETGSHHYQCSSDFRYNLSDIHSDLPVAPETLRQVSDTPSRRGQLRAPGPSSGEGIESVDVVNEVSDVIQRMTVPQEERDPLDETQGDADEAVGTSPNHVREGSQPQLSPSAAYTKINSLLDAIPGLRSQVLSTMRLSLSASAFAQHDGIDPLKIIVLRRLKAKRRAEKEKAIGIDGKDSATASFSATPGYVAGRVGEVVYKSLAPEEQRLFGGYGRRPHLYAAHGNQNIYIRAIRASAEYASEFPDSAGLKGLEPLGSLMTESSASDFRPPSSRASIFGGTVRRPKTAFNAEAIVGPSRCKQLRGSCQAALMHLTEGVRQKKKMRHGRVPAIVPDPAEEALPLVPLATKSHYRRPSLTDNSTNISRSSSFRSVKSDARSAASYSSRGRASIIERFRQQPRQRPRSAILNEYLNDIG